MKSSGKSCQWSHQAKDANEVIRQKLPVKSSGKSCQWSHQAKDANEVIRQKMPVKSSGISCQWSHRAKDASCGGRGGGGMPLCACQSVKFGSCSSGCPLKKKKQYSQLADNGVTLQYTSLCHQLTRKMCLVQAKCTTLRWVVSGLVCSKNNCLYLCGHGILSHVVLRCSTTWKAGTRSAECVGM